MLRIALPNAVQYCLALSNCATRCYSARSSSSERLAPVEIKRLMFINYKLKQWLYCNLYHGAFLFTVNCLPIWSVHFLFDSTWKSSESRSLRLLWKVSGGGNITRTEFYSSSFKRFKLHLKSDRPTTMNWLLYWVQQEANEREVSEAASSSLRYLLVRQSAASTVQSSTVLSTLLDRSKLHGPIRRHIHGALFQRRESAGSECAP